MHETSPELLAVARVGGAVSVLEAPLMVLDPAALPDPATLSDAAVRCWTRTAPASPPTCAARRAVAAVGVRRRRHRARRRPARPSATPPSPNSNWPRSTRSAPGSPTGRRISGAGRHAGRGCAGQRHGACGSDDVAEIVGVATLPSARRRGLGAALTATLARQLLDAGTDLVFLSAGSEEIARVYLRVGFRRIGTACIAEPAALIP